MDCERILEVLEYTDSVTVGVFGDFFLDKYLYIDSSLDEPSLETQLTAYQIVKKALYPGAAGTITNNLRALRANVITVGAVGDDGEGYELLRELQRIGADTSYMITSSEIFTPTYTKPMYMKDGGETELNRMDIRNFAPPSIDLSERLKDALRDAIEHCDAVVVCDQYSEPELGLVSGDMRDFLAELNADFPLVPIYVDSRGSIDRFYGVKVKCNDLEARACVEPDYDGEITENEIKRWGSKLFERTGQPVFITRGEKGSAVYDGSFHLIPSFKVEPPLDICGAGDANNSGIILGLALNLSNRDSALLGNAVSSLTIQQIGVTGTATPEMVAERIRTLM